MNYSEKEKKAIEYWKRDIKLYHYNTQLASEHYAQIVLNLIQKQESIIDKMAEQLTTPVHSKEWIIEFYKKEVEKDVKD